MRDEYSSQYREMVLAHGRAGRFVYDLAEGFEVSAATSICTTAWTGFLRPDPTIRKALGCPQC
jgi:hypothetical protein